MRRILPSLLILLFLFACSSDETGVVDPNFEEPDAGDEDIGEPDVGEIDVGEDDVGEPYIDELCEDEPSTSFCDNDRVVECSDEGMLSELQSCEEGCQESDDGAQCQCSDEYDCLADQRCIESLCVPDPCVGDGERFCDGDQSISCGDADPIDCDHGCSDGQCLCTDDAPCPTGYQCVAQGNSAGTCRVIDCEDGDQWCEADTLVACGDSDGDGATELDVCDGACVDHGDGDAFCGCASSEHCDDEEYCDPNGSCQPWECEPNTEVCDDDDNAVIVCSDEGTVEFTEACDALSCEDGVCQCDDDSQCADDQYCGTQNICRDQSCTPGDQSCSGDLLLLCNEQGSAQETIRSCPDDTECLDGACACSADEQCADGETCTDDACFCESEVLCSGGEECCAVGEECVTQEICDEGVCTTLELCLPECPDGQRCGEDGQLCCSGDTPVCDPRNICVPDCSNEGPLCGDDLDICCDAGDQCLFGECQTPGASCDNYLDCDFGEYCEEELGNCLADDFPDGLVCEQDFDFADIEPEVLWQWDGVDVDGTRYSNVMMTPLAADMDGSGTPNVIANAYREDGDGQQSIPVVIDGATGETLYYNATRFSHFATQLAAADVTGNGLPEIVAMDSQSGGIGLIENIVDCPDPEDDDDGCYLWWNDDDVETDQGAPLVADLNADGNVEIILRETILDGQTGEMIAQLDSGGYDYTVAVDVNGDGRLEILGAGCLYSLDEDHELSEVWCTDQPVADDDRKRYVAAGDITDEDGRAGMPEFVITGDSNVYVVAADDGTVLHQFPIYGDGAGGSPIIADFDGDGSAEFGIASANCYTVYDLDCAVPDADSDEDLMEDRPGCVRPEIETCDVGHHCACEDLQDTGGTGDAVLWSIYVQDESSHRTGSSVFDFQGNGRNEVVYNDECLLMVLDGQDGSPYFLHGNTNRTSSEYPIVVDVNGDNQTNIVVSANNDQFARDCEGPINDQPERFPECHPDDGDDAPAWCTEGTHGVVALQDPEDRWVRTRSVWNQFDYYIDNATDTAGVPTSPPMPWDSHNTFRANLQGEIPLNAPNPTVHSLSVNTLFCPEQITLSFVVENTGTRAIAADMPISIYRVDTDPDDLIDTVSSPDPIFPGQVVPFEIQFGAGLDALNADLEFRVVANDDGQGNSPEYDCDPDSATAVLSDVPCGT